MVGSETIDPVISEIITTVRISMFNPYTDLLTNVIQTDWEYKT